MTIAAATTRLHITPLTPELLPSVLPASIRPSATDVSFHCIPTFPENNYGYVTLPTMEAEKIKKKLNGSMLKGKKFKVEVARPQKRRRSEEDGDAVPEPKPVSVSESASKKRKADDGAIDGYELPSGRHVKRGWTESTNAKKERRKAEKKEEKGEKKTKTQAKSKYTEKSECLFRTNVPPNRSSIAAAVDKEEKKAKKKKKSSQESVVHEFAKTVTHPSFLRSAGGEATPTAKFEEGNGWVDDSGNIKEPVSDKIRKVEYRPGQVAGAKEKRKSVKASLKGNETGSRDLESTELDANRETPAESADESENWTSSSGSTSSDDESSDSESDASLSSGSSDESSVSSNKEERQEPRTQLKETGEIANTITAPTGTDAPVNSEPHSEETSNKPSSENVHPLEALFKRPAPDSSENTSQAVNNQFSFFGNGDPDIEEDEAEPVEPQTPFTKKDTQLRGLRSAAPTPDTALVGRHIKWNGSGETGDVNDEEDNEMYSNTPVSKPGPDTAGLKKEETEFANWFWEHRGENNRAWKRRRREAAKEHRQRENRRKGMKGKS